jgi:hypothetical protein
MVTYSSSSPSSVSPALSAASVSPALASSLAWLGVSLAPRAGGGYILFGSGAGRASRLLAARRLLVAAGWSVVECPAEHGLVGRFWFVFR